MNALKDFLDGDASSVGMRDHFLAMAKNVLGGSHDFLEVSGDAFHASISLDGVSLVSLWDDDVEPTTISLDQFIELMSR